MAKEMKTTVKIGGEVDASVRKAAESVSDSLDALERAAQSAAGPVSDLYDQISNQTKALKKTQIQYAGYVLAGEESSDAAQELADEIRQLSNDLNSNRSALDAAERAARDLTESYDDASDGVQDVGDSAANTSGGFGVMKVAIGNLVSEGIQKLISKAGEAVNWLLSLSEATQEYREDIGKLETAWESAGQSTELATGVYKEFYSVLGEEDRSVEAVNHLAKFVETEQDVAKWTDIATGVWGTFGDSLPIEGLTEAANETAKVGQITGPMADAINWSTTSTEEWNKALSGNKKALKAFQQGLSSGENAEDSFNLALAACGDEQERAALITDTLSSLYGEAAENYRENNESIIEARKATSDFTDAQAELGEKLEPLHTAFTQVKTELLIALMPAIEAIADKVLYFVNTILPKVINFIQTYVAPVIKTIADIISTVLGGAIGGIVTALGKVSDAFDVLSGKAGKLSAIKDTVSSVGNAVSGVVGQIKIPGYATGGFTSGVSIAGEAGTEAVISFDPAYRSQNLSYWAQAGRMLGATADDVSLLTSGDTSTSINLGGVTYNPEININGNASYDDIIRALRDDKAEFMDMLRSIVAEERSLAYV